MSNEASNLNQGRLANTLFFDMPQIRAYYSGQLAAAGFGVDRPISQQLTDSLQRMLAGMGIPAPPEVAKFFSQYGGVISSAIAMGGYNMFGPNIMNYLPMTQQSISGMMLYNALPFTGFLSATAAQQLGSAVYTAAGQLMTTISQQFPGLRPSDVIGLATAYTERGRGLMWDMLSGAVSMSPTISSDINRGITALYAMRNIYGTDLDPRVAMAQLSAWSGYNIGPTYGSRFALEMLSAQRLAYGVSRQEFTTALDIAAREAQAMGIPAALNVRSTAYGMALGGLMGLLGSPLLPETNIRMVSQQLLRGYTSYGAQLLGGLITGTIMRGAEVLGPEASQLEPAEIARRLNAPQLSGVLRSLAAGTYQGLPTTEQALELLGSIGYSAESAGRVLGMTRANQIAAARYISPYSVLGMQQTEIGQYAKFITENTMDSLGITLSDRAVGRISNRIAQGIDFFNPSDLSRFANDIRAELRANNIRDPNRIDQFTQSLITNVGAFFTNAGMYEQYSALGTLRQASEVMRRLDPKTQAQFSGLIEIAKESGRMQPLAMQLIRGLMEGRNIPEKIQKTWQTMITQSSLTSEEQKALEQYVKEYEVGKAMPENIKGILGKIRLEEVDKKLRFTKYVEVVDGSTGRKAAEEREKT